MRMLQLRRSPRPDAQAQSWVADDSEVAARLERYAAESLSPDEAALDRVGAVVRAAFVEAVIAHDTGRRAHTLWRRRRAVAALGAVAVLTLSTVGFAAAESGPGQPFYRIRLGIETINQPPAGSQNRIAADLARADSRLNDVAGSAVDSNWNAAADAAGAYREVVTGIMLPADAAAKGQALSRLRDQLTRLEELRARSKGQASVALDGDIAALCNLLGVPIPTFDNSTAPDPGPRVSGRDGDAVTSPGQAGGDGGRDRGKSATPSPTAGSGRPGGSGTPAGSWSDRPGKGGGGPSDQAPTPRPGGDGGRVSEPNQQPWAWH
jgi:hypothetical protein